jgi:hypothetical protein
LLKADFVAERVFKPVMIGEVFQPHSFTIGAGLLRLVAQLCALEPALRAVAATPSAIRSAAVDGSRRFANRDDVEVADVMYGSRSQC